MSEGGELYLEAPSTLAGEVRESLPAGDPAIPANLQDYLDSRERAILSRVLQETRFNRTAAAARLGLSLRQMRYRIARLNISMPDSGTPEAPESPQDRA